MTSDEERLAGYVAAWRSAVDDTLLLLRGLDDDDWARPTDLPGWDVRAVAAHLAHLEAELAGFEQQPVEVPELDHLRSPMAYYTERGPIARAAWTPAQIVDELERAADVRFRALQADPPTDGSGAPPITPGDIGWSWEVLLRNRPLDVWMHEQDIRRAVRRPGGLDTAGAAHTAAVFATSFGFSVGKRVAPPAGTTAVLDVSAVSPVQPVHRAVRIDPDGRAVPFEPADDGAAAPTVHLRMGFEPYILLCGGRRAVDDVPVQVSGDQELGRRILQALAVTP